MEYLPSKQNMLLGIPISLVALRYLLNNKKKEEITKTDFNNPISDINKRIIDLNLKDFNSLIEKVKTPIKKTIILKNKFLQNNDLHEIKSKIKKNSDFINTNIDKLNHKKTIIFDHEIKNLPKHISIKGKFQELDYHKIYDYLNLLKNIIYDNVDNLILNLDLIQALDNKKFNSLVDQWCNTKKIITNIDINNIPTIELKDALLSKLKIILESIISYTNKINEILDLFDYIISNSLKKNLYLFDNDKCIELNNFNIYFKQTLQSMNNSISINIINIIETLEKYTWINNKKVLSIKNNYQQLKNNFSGNIKISSLKTLDIKLLTNNSDKINIEELLTRENIDKYEYFYLSFLNIID